MLNANRQPVSGHRMNHGKPEATRNGTVYATSRLHVLTGGIQPMMVVKSALALKMQRWLADHLPCSGNGVPTI